MSAENNPLCGFVLLTVMLVDWVKPEKAPNPPDSKPSDTITEPKSSAPFSVLLPPDVPGLVTVTSASVPAGKLGGVTVMLVELFTVTAVPGEVTPFALKLTVAPVAKPAPVITMDVGLLASTPP